MIGRLFPLVFVVIAVAIFFVYVEPTYTGQIADSQQQIQSYESALAAADIFTQKDNSLIAERNAIPAPEITRLSDFLPDGVDNIQLILDLNSLAQRSGVSLSNFQVQDNATSTDGSSVDSSSGSSDPSSLTDSLQLSVAATGTYSAFQTFLAASEQSLRPLDVMSLNLKDSPTGVYTYAITYQIYWLQ